MKPWSTACWPLPTTASAGPATGWTWPATRKNSAPTTNSPYALRYAYRYRDWVAEAFNRDLGYDRFIMQQIAGDLMSGVGTEGWSALGFLSLGPIYESDGGGKESKLRHRYDTMDDKIDTLSRAVLGLTVSCARCHDHKFDPIPTEDYYSLAGVFFNTEYVPRKWMVLSRVSDRYEYLEALLKDKKKCVDRAKTHQDLLPGRRSPTP